MATRRISNSKRRRMFYKALQMIPGHRGGAWLLPVFYKQPQYPELKACISAAMSQLRRDQDHHDPHDHGQPLPGRLLQRRGQGRVQGVRRRLRAGGARRRRDGRGPHAVRPMRGRPVKTKADLDALEPSTSPQLCWQFGDAAPVPADSVDDATLMCASPPLDASVRSDDLSVAPCATPRCAVR